MIRKILQMFCKHKMNLEEISIQEDGLVARMYKCSKCDYRITSYLEK
jgi:hypothetical protein